MEALHALKGEQVASSAAKQSKVSDKIGEYQAKLRVLLAEKEEEGRKQRELTAQY
jgi:hypothetical protein